MGIYHTSRSVLLLLQNFESAFVISSSPIMIGTPMSPPRMLCTNGISPQMNIVFSASLFLLLSRCSIYYQAIW